MKKKISLTTVALLVFITILFSSSSFAATVGQSMTGPETGWHRINDNDPLINYVGTFSYISNASTVTAYNKDTHLTTVSGDKVMFYFNGTKLRLIGAYVLNRSNKIEVYIDSILVDTFSEHADLYGIGQILVYEKTGLTNEKHIVEIIN